MKSALICLVLAIFAHEFHASVLKVTEVAEVELTNFQVKEVAEVAGADEVVVVADRATRANLIAGYPVNGDRLLARQVLRRNPVANSIQSEDLIFRSANLTTRITSVQALEVGGTQYASAFIVSGGLGRANVTVRAQSSRGYGYYYQVDIWGR